MPLSRNIVKADNWFESVRNKLDDPAFAGFFVRFDPQKLSANSTINPACDNSYSPPKCT